MYINNLGHMTKMAAMPIYGKNPSKIIFSETNRLISRKLGVRHRWLKYSNVYINHDPVMTLTKFMARSTWVACASELGKLLKCHLKEKANRKLANGQNIEDSEKRKWPKGLSAPALELNTIIFKHVYWYMQLISGERLQDHWSSGCHSSIFVFQQIFFILAGYKDNYNLSYEFKFRPAPTSDCRVSCPLVFEKSIFCIVATLAPSILMGPSSFLEVTRITITSWMSLNLSQIRPWTAELAALECLKNQF